MKNQLKIGVILSYINLAISSIIPFVYTPVMLRILGQSEYGLYSLSSSTVAYLSLLSFGFGSTIIRYMSKYRAQKDQNSEEKVFGFFIILYSLLAILVIVGGFIIAINTNTIFHEGLSGQESSKMRILVLIMTLNSSLSFPISVFSSVVIAHEKYIFRKIVDIFLTIAAPITNLIALYLGFASIGMSLSSTFINIIVLPLNIFYCFKVIKLKPKFSRLPKGLIKEMVGFSFFVFIGNIVDMLFWATDKVILGMRASTVAVAIYNVGATFNNTVMNLSMSISGVLTPKITGMVALEVSKEHLTDLFVKVGRLQFYIIALIVTGFTVFGSSFIILWAGTDYSNAYWVAVLTMFPLCIPLIQNTGLSIVVAQNKHQFRSIVYLIIAIANVISTYLIIPRMGIIGAALCSCVSYLIGQGIIMNVYYYKVTGIDIPLFWRNILKISLIPFFMMIAGLAICKYVHFNNWWIFIAGVACYTVVYAVLMYFVCMNDYEKDIFRKPVYKVLSKIKK